MNRETKLAVHYAKKYWYLYLLGIAALTAVDAFMVIIPRITGGIIDGLREQTMDAAMIRSALLGMFGLGFVVAAGRFGWRYCFFGAARNVERDIRNDLFSHLERLSFGYYNNTKIGQLMARLTSDLFDIAEFAHHVYQPLGVSRMKADARLVENIQRTGKTAAKRADQVDSLALSTAQGVVMAA